MLPLFAHDDEAGFAQDLEVLRHGRLAESECGDDFGDARAAVRAGGSLRSRRICRMSRRVASAITSKMSAMGQG